MNEPSAPAYLGVSACEPSAPFIQRLLVFSNMTQVPQHLPSGTGLGNDV